MTKTIFAKVLMRAGVVGLAMAVSGTAFAGVRSATRVVLPAGSVKVVQTQTAKAVCTVVGGKVVSPS